MSILLNGGAPILAFKLAVSENDIENFLNGPVSFGLFAGANVIFFLFKIDGFLDWSDLAFTIHLAQGESVDEGSYLPFHLVLLESGTSIVKGLRIITVSPAFRSALAKLIKRQAAERFDTIGYTKPSEAFTKLSPRRPGPDVEKRGRHRARRLDTARLRAFRNDMEWYDMISFHIT